MTDGSPYPSTTSSFPLPAIRLAPIGYPQILARHEGTTSSTKSRIQKSRRDSQSPAEQTLARRGHGSSPTPALGPPIAGPHPIFQARGLPLPSATRIPSLPNTLNPRPGKDEDHAMGAPPIPARTSTIPFTSPTLHDPSRASSPTTTPSNARDEMALDIPRPAAAYASAGPPLQIATIRLILFIPRNLNTYQGRLYLGVWSAPLR